MTAVPIKETKRQYRVLRQTLSMHAMLRDGFSFKAKASEVLLLVCSTIFCATTFASDDLYKFFGLVPSTSRVILGIASIIAFILSLMLLVVDFKGKAALHRQAVERWSEVLAKYRKYQNDDGTWLEKKRDELNIAYWEADRNSIKIPEQQFNRLKSRYLRKVALSQLKSSYPGCPMLFLVFLLRFQDIKNALRGGHAEKKEGISKSSD